jgi:hypothetical protein
LRSPFDIPSPASLIFLNAITEMLAYYRLSS